MGPPSNSPWQEENLSCHRRVQTEGNIHMNAQVKDGLVLEQKMHDWTADGYESQMVHKKDAFHSPSGSDNSSIFSTLDSSSFSSRSEASSFAKKELSPSCRIQCLNLSSVSSRYLPPIAVSSLLSVYESTLSSAEQSKRSYEVEKSTDVECCTTDATANPEFDGNDSRKDDRIVRNRSKGKAKEHDMEVEVATKDLPSTSSRSSAIPDLDVEDLDTCAEATEPHDDLLCESTQLILRRNKGSSTGVSDSRQGDGNGTERNGSRNEDREFYPVRTCSTWHSSKEVQACINPCFERIDDSIESPTQRHLSKKKRIAKSLGSVLSRHFASNSTSKFLEKHHSICSMLSSHPTQTNQSLRLGSELCVPAGGEAIETGDTSWIRCFSPARSRFTSPNANRFLFWGNGLPKRTSFVYPSGRSDSQIIRPEDYGARLYRTSPRHRSQTSKSSGCLGLESSDANAVFTKSTPIAENGPLYYASDGHVRSHGRCLPTPRKAHGMGRSYSVLKQHDPPVARVNIVPSTTLNGHVHCAAKDGLPIYTFLIDDCDDALVAKAWRPSSTSQVGSDYGYLFYSYKQNGKHKNVWKNWVRKEKPASSFVGKMMVNSSSCTDEGNFTELQFALLAGESDDQSSSAACSPRLSVSTLDTTPSRSPHLHMIGSPCPSIYGLFSPTKALSGMASPRTPRYSNTSRYISLSMVPRNLTSPQWDKTKKSYKYKKAARSHNSSPVRSLSDEPWQDALSDPETIDAEEYSDDQFQSHQELAAIVIRVPHADNRITTLGESLYKKWRWGNASTTSETSIKHPTSSCTSIETKENISGNEVQENNQSNNSGSEPTSVTVILPAGAHSLPLYGSDGPQPLIERWQSGGCCDCGSWDLGCGLTILGNQPVEGTVSLDHENGSPSSKETLKIFLQGKGYEKASMSLTPLHEGLFSLSFQSPMSIIQAFASAVAVLHSVEPVIRNTHQDKKLELSRPPRIPFRPLPHRQASCRTHGNNRPSERMLEGYCAPKPPPWPLDRL